MKIRLNKAFALIAVMAMILAACGTTAETTTTAGGGGDALPGEGVSLNMGRANWASGYFQAYVFHNVLEELGYDVSDPSEQEVDPSLAYLAMAQGDFDFWVNSWYPGHLAWHDADMPDGSKVGDHLDIVGLSFAGGGIQGWLIEKNFADKYDIKTMEDFNNNPDAIAEYDASDPVPGNGIADIYGCQESYTCDNIIQNMIAFGDGEGNSWDNITQVIASYDNMFAEAEDKVKNEGLPIIIYTWTPTAYVGRLVPGVDVYWLGVAAPLDESNPAEQDGGSDHQQLESLTGLTSLVAVPADQCPAAADHPEGLCPMGWLPATITPTANSDVLDAHAAFKALLENLSLSVVDVSVINFNVDQEGGAEDLYRQAAADWIADNRDLVDAAIAAAIAAAG